MLKLARARGVLDFEGSVLLMPGHKDVVITLLDPNSNPNNVCCLNLFTHKLYLLSLQFVLYLTIKPRPQSSYNPRNESGSFHYEPSKSAQDIILLELNQRSIAIEQALRKFESEIVCTKAGYLRVGREIWREFSCYGHK